MYRSTPSVEMDLWNDLSRQVLDTSVWSRDLIYDKGSPTRFNSLFSWDSLNRLLEEHTLPFPRLRLFRCGAKVDPHRYQERRRDGQTGLVRQSGLYREFANGATLVLDSVDELWPPLRDFADRVEAIFHVRVNINLYASFRADNGFGMHSDDSNILILQASGRKFWKVWRPDCQITDPPIDADPFWQGNIEQGDALHVPRGWPHMVQPLNEPTLHLTVNVSNLTGVEFLNWLVAKIAAHHADIRMDVPISDTVEQQLEWLAKIRAYINLAWSNDLVSDFIEYVDGATPPRPRLQLPEGPQLGCMKITDSTQVRLLGVRPIRFRREQDGHLSFVFAGRRWSIAEYSGRVLNLLNDFRPHPVSELADSLTQIQQAEFLDILVDLITQGVIAFS